MTEPDVGRPGASECDGPGDDVGPGVGAFVTDRVRLNAIVSLLRKRRLLKKQPNVTPYRCPDTGAVLHAAHVRATEARVDAALVAEAAALGAAWRPGLRIHSAECVVGAPAPAVAPAAAADGMAAQNADWSAATATAAVLVPPRFRFAELFAGIGGFRVGFESVGGACVFASELNACARRVYAANCEGGAHPPPLLVGDITEVEGGAVPDHDVLTAGFPCQSFSKVGTLTGLGDHRGVLFFEVVRVLRAKRPAAFLLENVENLTTMNEGRDFAVILEALRGVGYACATRVVDSGVLLPQVRRRVFFVGFRADTGVAERFAWPDVFGGGRFGSDASAAVAAAAAPVVPPLRSVLDLDPGAAALAPLLLTATQARALAASSSFSRHPEWRVANLDSKAQTIMSNYRHGYTLYSEFVPVSPDPARAHDPTNLRFYSPREAARLQGFAESFVLVPPGSPPNTAYRLFGNAVCPPVVARIAAAMVAAMEGARAHDATAPAAVSSPGVVV